jgi:hypothetical protein
LYIAEFGNILLLLVVVDRYNRPTIGGGVHSVKSSVKMLT